MALTTTWDLSAGRFLAVLAKEFIQMRRDRLTFAMMVGIPLMQLVLFGFAINFNPQQLPTAVLSSDPGPLSQRLIQDIEDSGYFQPVTEGLDEAEAERRLALGQVQFVVKIPQDFSARLLLGERPTVSVEADTTDPATTNNALCALNTLTAKTLTESPLTGLSYPSCQPAPFDLTIHRRYNPEGITAHHIVPGLMGVLLTMSMVMMTALVVTRERERGTLENLLATPVRPVEVMTGKMLPYILVGYVQFGMILLALRYVFEVPIQGSVALLAAVALLFIAANLMLGITLSTLAKNQMQAMQMTFFFFLPSMLLSGFMFPFRGMPGWAQAVGEWLPLTHFLRVVRGIVLKGNGFAEVWPHLWPIAVFLLVVSALGLILYRTTLD